jgi:hypothetical protein
MPPPRIPVIPDVNPVTGLSQRFYAHHTNTVNRERDEFQQLIDSHAIEVIPYPSSRFEGVFCMPSQRYNPIQEIMDLHRNLPIQLIPDEVLNAYHAKEPLSRFERIAKKCP